MNILDRLKPGEKLIKKGASAIWVCVDRIKEPESWYIMHNGLAHWVGLADLQKDYMKYEETKEEKP